MTKTILVVDAERHMRALLEHTLCPFEEVGVQLHSVENPEQAILFCKQSPPDLVFVDGGIPEKGGFILCEAIHADPATSHTRIVLMAERGKEPNLEGCKYARVIQIVAKPFDPDRVRLLTGSILGIDVEL